MYRMMMEGMYVYYLYSVGDDQASLERLQARVTLLRGLYFNHLARDIAGPCNHVGGLYPSAMFGFVPINIFRGFVVHQDHEEVCTSCTSPKRWQALDCTKNDHFLHLYYVLYKHGFTSRIIHICHIVIMLFITYDYAFCL